MLNGFLQTGALLLIRARLERGRPFGEPFKNSEIARANASGCSSHGTCPPYLAIYVSVEFLITSLICSAVFWPIGSGAPAGSGRDD